MIMDIVAALFIFFVVLPILFYAVIFVFGIILMIIGYIWEKISEVFS